MCVYIYPSLAIYSTILNRYHILNMILGYRSVHEIKASSVSPEAYGLWEKKVRNKV